jgi:ATP-dependent RNA helicase DeaD
VRPAAVAAARPASEPLPDDGDLMGLLDGMVGARTEPERPGKPPRAVRFAEPERAQRPERRPRGVPADRAEYVRHDRAGQPDRAARPGHGEHAEHTEPSDHDEAHKQVWFTINIGRSKNADPKWLVPLLCRRGGISKNAIGKIQIFARETRVEISHDVSERFAAAVREPDAKDRNIHIEPLDTFVA